MKKILIAVLAASTIILGGCASTAHQTAHRVTRDATSEFAVYQAAGQVAGDIGSWSVAGLGILNHIFKPSVDAGSTCVNGIGQKIDCDTKEPIQE